MPIPKYLEKGSKGPAVVPLLAFLVGWGFGWCEVPDGFKADDELGELGMKLIAKYQEDNGLSVEGGCGPQMRANLLDHGFDFELAACSAGSDLTTFVQPDGTKVEWSPRMD